jgi:protein-S-isoprenylcysteine O-methyltransferase Ste14
MPNLEHRVPPPVVGLLLALAMWLLAKLPPVFHLATWLREGLALLLVAGGVTFDALGLLAFVRQRTTVNPLHPENASALVTGGVYRVTRNPMYVGMALLLTAWAVDLSAAWPFLGPVAFVLYMNRFQIAPEERALGARFGASWTAYAARVRRWL